MSAKRVVLTSYHLIPVEPRHEVVWADVSVRFKSGPRAPHEWGVTLHSRTDLLRDIELDAEIKAANEGIDLGDEERIHREAFAALEGGRPYVLANDKKQFADIYSPSDWLDVSEAERMLRHFMDTMGFRNVKFAWRRTAYLIRPA